MLNWGKCPVTNIDCLHNRNWEILTITNVQYTHICNIVTFRQWPLAWLDSSKGQEKLKLNQLSRGKCMHECGN